MKEMWLELLNEYRFQHGLRGLTLRIPASAGITEQNLADTALYEGRLFEVQRVLSHSPETIRNVPHYSCLTPGISKAAAKSNLAAFQGIIDMGSSVAWPYAFLSVLLGDVGELYPGHRVSLLNPHASMTSVGWTHVNYTHQNLSSSLSPVHFNESSEQAAAVVAPVFLEETPHTLTDEEKNIVFPAAGRGIHAWSRSYVSFSPGWRTASLLTKTYDVTMRVPVVTVVDENTNRRLIGKIVARKVDPISANSFILAWQLDPSESVRAYPGSPSNIRFTISNLHPIGQPLSAPPVSVTWRNSTEVYTDVELEVRKKGEGIAESTEILFEAAHLYDGWEYDLFDPQLYRPWQLQASATPDFKNPIALGSIEGLQRSVDSEGMCHITVPNRDQFKYFRLARVKVKLPEGYYYLHPITP
jgi:hypothetical protein